MLGDKESVADEAYCDVMVPTSVAATFKVIEAELILEVLIDAFSSPAVFDLSDHCLA